MVEGEMVKDFHKGSEGGKARWNTQKTCAGAQVLVVRWDPHKTMWWCLRMWDAQKIFMRILRCEWKGDMLKRLCHGAQVLVVMWDAYKAFLKRFCEDSKVGMVLWNAQKICDSTEVGQLGDILRRLVSCFLSLDVEVKGLKFLFMRLLRW